MLQLTEAATLRMEKGSNSGNVEQGSLGRNGTSCSLENDVNGSDLSPQPNSDFVTRMITVEEIKEGREYDGFACFEYEDGIVVKLMDREDCDPTKFDFDEREQGEDIGGGGSMDGGAKLLPNKCTDEA